MRPYHGQHKKAPGKGHAPAPKGPANKGGGKGKAPQYPSDKNPMRSSGQLDTGGFAKTKPALVAGQHPPTFSGPYNRGEGAVG